MKYNSSYTTKFQPKIKTIHFFRISEEYTACMNDVKLGI